MTNERSHATLPARWSRGQAEFKWKETRGMLRVSVIDGGYIGMGEVKKSTQTRKKERMSGDDADHEVVRLSKMIPCGLVFV